MMEPIDEERFLYGDDEVIDLDEPAPVPRDQGRVSWHLRKLGAIDRQKEHEAALFDAEIKRLTLRRLDRMEVLERSAGWHAKAVEAWHRAMLAAGSVGKTVKLPGGESALRAAQPSTEIFDEDALRAWLSAQPAPNQTARIRTLEDLVYPVKEPELSRSALKAAVAMVGKKDREAGAEIPAVHPETGEVVPGVRFRSMPERHNAKGA